jgi:hypothetical protein
VLWNRYGVVIRRKKKKNITTPTAHDAMSNIVRCVDACSERPRSPADHDWATLTRGEPSLVNLRVTQVRFSESLSTTTVTIHIESHGWESGIYKETIREASTWKHANYQKQLDSNWKPSRTTGGVNLNHKGRLHTSINNIGKESAEQPSIRRKVGWSSRQRKIKENFCRKTRLVLHQPPLRPPGTIF